MGEIKSVYTSNDPRHIEALKATEAALLAVRPARDAFVAEYPGCELMGRDGVVSAVHFPTTKPGEERLQWNEPTPGWPDPAVWCKVSNKSRDHRQFRPRAKGGEEMSARLRTMNAPDRTSFVGMPDFAGLFSRPGYRLVGDTVWMVWSVNADDLERSPSFDATIWQRRKLSEYHVMLESLPAEEAPDEDQP